MDLCMQTTSAKTAEGKNEIEMKIQVVNAKQRTLNSQRHMFLTAQQNEQIKKSNSIE